MRKILVVDDERMNRVLLREMLADGQTTILEASSGEEALAIAEQSSPDLVITDVMMPGIDGFETARRLKESAGDIFLPVIIATGLTDRDSRLHGFEVGADEFITKPIDRTELRMRVRTLFGLRQKELQLRDRNMNLLELVRFRDEMGSLLVHDLKSPASVLRLCLEALQKDERLLPASAVEALHDARGANERIIRIVENMLDLVHLESQRLVLHRSPTRPADLLRAAADGRGMIARSRTVSLELEGDRNLQVSADVDLITRVIENVLDNSLRHVPRGGRILMKCEAHGDLATIAIGNDGPPVPTELREAIFDKFTRGEGGTRNNLGFGLYFCRLAVEAHGGRIWVADHPMPAVFGLDLPISPMHGAYPDLAARLH
jgi:two-component system sensor histidine kinase/response regulator